MTVQVGSPRGHASPCAVSLSGHQFCSLRALVSLPPCCPGFPPQPLLLHPPRTPRNQTRDFSSTLLGSLPHTPLPLLASFPRPAKTNLFRARLDILFFSPIGSLECVCDSQWVLAIHSVLQASQREMICCLLFPSCFLSPIGSLWCV
jgi:hypothetical protein